MNIEYKKRLYKLIKPIIIIAIIGFSYYLFVMLTDIKIPCVFSRVTGLYCPGCGVSRMCISIIQLDFKAAFGYNQLVFCLLPFFVYEGVCSAVKYIKTGSRYLGKEYRIVWTIILCLLIIFGILRNIDMFSYLRP